MKTYCEEVDRGIDHVLKMIGVKYDQYAWIFLDIFQAFDNAGIFSNSQTGELLHILSDLLSNRRVLSLILSKSVMNHS